MPCSAENEPPSDKHDLFDLLADRIMDGGVLRLRQNREMQIAVAQMTDRQIANACVDLRQFRLGACKERRRRLSNGTQMSLSTRASPCISSAAASRIAHIWRRCCFVLGDHRISDFALRRHLAEQVLELALHRHTALVVGRRIAGRSRPDFDQDRHWMAVPNGGTRSGSRDRQPRHVVVGHVFKGLDRAAECLSQAVQQRESRVKPVHRERSRSHRLCGFGNSRKTAPVITPNVPSAPMNRSRRS